MLSKKDKIQIWFKSWITKTDDKIDDIFSKYVVYIESDSTTHKGIENIKKWFKTWNEEGQVLIWDIEEIHEDLNISFVTWFFKCMYKGREYAFFGATYISWNEEEKITYLREYMGEC